MTNGLLPPPGSHLRRFRRGLRVLTHEELCDLHDGLHGDVDAVLLDVLVEPLVLLGPESVL